MRNQFIKTGALDNSNDDNHRAINDRYPVFGFSNNLGRVGSSQANSLFTIFHAQRDGAQLNTGSGLEAVPSYWSGQYGTDEDALAFFHGDYNGIYDKSVQLDGKITNDAVAVGGQDYLTIVSLGAREALGATSVAGTEQSPYIFMKEISSNGNMNTADVIFPASPIFLYLNPTWLKYLLDPLYIIQENGLYPQDFALHDIGAHYPNGTGHADGIAQEQPVEESGNMLIMTLAYAQKTGDTAYLTAHYPHLRQWADYLVQNCLIPANQQSTDDFAGLLANQTNLALKGIIGIQAMSAIASLTGNPGNYSATAKSYIARWQDLGIARNATPPHTTLSYGDTASHGLLYNLYADALLKTNLVPRSVYEMQSAFTPRCRTVLARRWIHATTGSRAIGRCSRLRSRGMIPGTRWLVGWRGGWGKRRRAHLRRICTRRRRGVMRRGCRISLLDQSLAAGLRCWRWERWGFRGSWLG